MTISVTPAVTTSLTCSVSNRTTIKRQLTRAWRLLRVALHIAEGLAVASVIFPFISDAGRQRRQQRWSQRLLAMLGVRLEVAGDATQHGLLVANHISWLDVFVISSITPATFVCKAEVRNWPAIGLLCAKTGTIFIERGSRAAARHTNEAVADRLRGGRQVAVFPEGTTTDGSGLLPFRAALLQAVVDTNSMVQPVALRYSNSLGERVDDATYIGDTSFVESLSRIAGSEGLIAGVSLLAPLTVEASSGADRRGRGELALMAQTSIQRALECSAAPS